LKFDPGLIDKLRKKKDKEENELQKACQMEPGEN
jgi:hypothetical protein